MGTGIYRIGEWGVGSGITALGSGITDHGIGISSFFRDQGSGCTIFVRSGTNIGHAFGIKDQKFAYENGINIEKTYLVTTLLCRCTKRFWRTKCVRKNVKYSRNSMILLCLQNCLHKEKQRQRMFGFHHHLICLFGDGSISRTRERHARGDRKA